MYPDQNIWILTSGADLSLASNSPIHLLTYAWAGNSKINKWIPWRDPVLFETTQVGAYLPCPLIYIYMFFFHKVNYLCRLKFAVNQSTAYQKNTDLSSLYFLCCLLMYFFPPWAVFKEWARRAETNTCLFLS